MHAPTLAIRQLVHAPVEVDSKEPHEEVAPVGVHARARWSTPRQKVPTVFTYLPRSAACWEAIISRTGMSACMARGQTGNVEPYAFDYRSHRMSLPHTQCKTVSSEGDRFATPVARKEGTPAIQSIVVVGMGAKDHSRIVSVDVAACVGGEVRDIDNHLTSSAAILLSPARMRRSVDFPVPLSPHKSIRAPIQWGFMGRKRVTYIAQTHWSGAPNHRPRGSENVMPFNTGLWPPRIP